jgi:type I restriction enzyme M protein
LITGELRSKVDALWNAFWSGGIANPLEVIEQITYLLFIRRLDDLHTAQEKKTNRLGGKLEGIFPLTKDGEKLRWSRFKNFSPQEMFDVISTKVFPFIRSLKGDVDDSTYSHHMRDARFTIPTPGLLSKVVELVDDIPMDDRDTKGDVYEYMLGKIASAGLNGQFRTPRHIIKMIVELVAPTPNDIVCDPACGTAGFLVATAEYIYKHHPEVNNDPKLIKHFRQKLFNGFDFDNTMLRIASMNMLLHGVGNPNVLYKDSLSEDHAGEEERYSLILANPPFAGQLDVETTASDLLRIVNTKKTELLFLALFLRLLKPGGRAAVIVPDGVLFGSSKAHRDLRRILIEDHKLEAVISMPSGVFKPYAGVSTAVVIFTKTNSGGTDSVWFYDMLADGYSLDDKRQPLLSEDKLTSLDITRFNKSELEKYNLPDVVSRWQNRSEEFGRTRLEQSFYVSKEELVATKYDLNLKRYKDIAVDQIKHGTPQEVLFELKVLEEEIMSGLSELEVLIN